MAWTSSATPQGLVCLGDGHLRADGAQDLAPAARAEPEADRQTLGWLRIAALLHLTVIVAAVPTGPELAALLVSGATGLALLVLWSAHGAGKKPELSALCQPLAPVSEPMSFLALAPAPVCAPEPARPAAALAAAPQRPCDEVWRDLMGHISHEMRTPLNAIIGFSDLMNQELFGPVGHPRYQEYLSHIRDSSRSLLKSAEDTLALTELLARNRDGGTTATIDLADLLGDCVSHLAMDRGCCLPRLAIADAGGLAVEGDRRALRQILINLLSEAADRTGPSGSVTVAMASQDGHAVIDISVTPSTGTSEGEGTPLRLTLARMLLELQGCGHLEGPRTDGRSWSIRCVLDQARQPDLFAHRLH